MAEALILRVWGAPFEAQGKEVLRPYMTVATGDGEARHAALGQDAKVERSKPRPYKDGANCGAGEGERWDGLERWGGGLRRWCGATR